MSLIRRRKKSEVIWNALIFIVMRMKFPAFAKKKAVFLSTVGHTVFERIKDLMYPVVLSDAALDDIRSQVTRTFQAPNRGNSPRGSNFSSGCNK